MRIAYNLLSDKDHPAGTLKSVTGPFAGNKSFLLKKHLSQPLINTAFIRNNHLCIEIHMEKSQYIKMDLFNLLGRKIRPTYRVLLINGKHKIQIPIGNRGTGQINGTLLLSVTIGSSKSIKKVTTFCKNIY